MLDDIALIRDVMEWLYSLTFKDIILGVAIYLAIKKFFGQRKTQTIANQHERDAKIRDKAVEILSKVIEERNPEIAEAAEQMAEQDLEASVVIKAAKEKIRNGKS